MAAAMVPTLGEGGADFISHLLMQKKCFRGATHGTSAYPRNPLFLSPVGSWWWLAGSMLLLALSPACVTGEVTRSLQSCKGGCSGAFPHWGGELAPAGGCGGARWESRQTSVHFSTLQRTRRQMGRRWQERVAFLASKPGKLSLPRLPRVKVDPSRG